MKLSRNPFIICLTFSQVACLTANAITWDGGSTGTDNWVGGNGINSGERNWDTNNAPVAGDPLIFGGTTRLAPNNNTTADTSYGGITFNGTAGAFVLGGNRITLGGDVSNNDTDLQTINMNLLLSATRTFNAASGDLRVGGIIDDGASTFGLTKTGSGVLTLAAVNTYNGDTTVKAGTLKLDGIASILSTKIIVGDTGINGASLDVSTNTVSGGFQVTGTQTLSGTGTVIGASTIQLNGIVAPGNSGAGALNTGDINFASGSIFQVELSSATSYDQLNVAGGVTLAGLLQVSVGYTPVNDTLFFPVVNDGVDAISGTFSDVTDLSVVTFGSQQFKVSYTGNSLTNSFTGGNDFVMMTVPEPSAALLGGLGALFLLRRRRNA